DSVSRAFWRAASSVETATSPRALSSLNMSVTVFLSSQNDGPGEKPTSSIPDCEHRSVIGARPILMGHGDEPDVGRPDEASERPDGTLSPRLHATVETHSIFYVARDTLCSGGSHGSTGTRSSTPVQTGASGSDPGRGTGSDQHLRQARRASSPHACTAARSR